MKPIHIADLFCGAGGTSTGAIQAAHSLGRKVHLTAINHWERAIETHSANHPDANHLCARIEDVTPESIFRRNELDLLWASPECTHFSRARGGAPIDDQRRVGAWRVVDWAERLCPTFIMVENVSEFLEWGPLKADGSPCQKRKGELFQQWAQTLRVLGYKVEWRLLRAADYGDPTTRQRLFVQAVRGNKRIVWPDPTHQETTKQPDLFRSELPAWRPASEIIDWSIPCPSIFTRSKPLAENTLKRIFAGLKKYGMEEYLVQLRGTRSEQINASHLNVKSPLPTITAGGGHYGLVKPFLVTCSHGNGKNKNGDARRVKPITEPLQTISCINNIGLAQPFLVHLAHGTKITRSVDRPLGTVVAGNPEWCLVQPHLLPQQSDGRLRPISEPAPTIATAGAIALVHPFLTQYYGTAETADIGNPLPTVTCNDRFGLVRPTVHRDGETYELDIGYRMLQPHELAAAQGFPADYQFKGTKTEITRQIGNAVCPGIARALVTAALTQNSNVGRFTQAA